MTDLGPSAAVRRAAHLGARLACASTAQRFEVALGDLRATQLAALRRILSGIDRTERARQLGLSAGMSPEQFRRSVPECSYSDVARDIDEQRASGRCVLTNDACARYQPTSGSTSTEKWIPYTQSFLGELDQAIGAWGHDLYARYPGIRCGRHYWSMSWIPTSMRGQLPSNVADDRALLSRSKRMMSWLTSAVPAWVSYTATSQASVFATVCFLVSANDLSLLSVWSPTFALNLLDQLGKWREAIAEVFERGAWPSAMGAFPGKPPMRARRAAALLRSWDGEATSDFFKELWPKLALISSWDTGSSARWAARLAGLFPQASFQGKGLWATEGVVTIPYRERYPLAVLSHFFEFVDLDTDKPLFAWELKSGQMVRPLLTTGSGLLRYRLEDRLRVTELLHGTPCFEFVGRLAGVDLVGEKMSPDMARFALETVAQDSDCIPLTLLAVTNPIGTEKPCFVALCEGRSDQPSHKSNSRSWILEQSLRHAFHYNLARDLGQLGPAQVLVRPDARRLYADLGALRGITAGNLKLESLILCAGKEAARRLTLSTVLQDNNVIDSTPAA